MNICRLYLLFTLLFCCSTTFAQVDNAQTVPGNTTNAWETYMKPNEVHQFLSQYSGNWNGEITMWLNPKSQPEKFKVSNSNKMILGGRYLQSSASGYMVGTTFEGMNTLGYNTTNQKFTLTIIDNMGTGTLTLVGFWITPFKSLELFGDIPTPENTDVIHVKQVISFVDKDTYVIQNFDKRAGQDEYKSVEYRFTRKK